MHANDKYHYYVIIEKKINNTTAASSCSKRTNNTADWFRLETKQVVEEVSPPTTSCSGALFWMESHDISVSVLLVKDLVR